MSKKGCGIFCGLFSTKLGKKICKLTKYTVKKVSVHVYHVSLNAALLMSIIFLVYFGYYFSARSHIRTPDAVELNTTTCEVLKAEFKYDSTKFFRFDLFLRYPINEYDTSNQTIYKNVDYVGLADPFNYAGYKCWFKAGRITPCSYNINNKDLVYLPERKKTYWYCIGTVIASLVMGIFFVVLASASAGCYCCMCT